MAFWAEDLWGSVKSFFTEMFRSVWSGFLEMVTFLPSKVVENTHIQMLYPTDEGWEQMIANYRSLGLIDEQTGNNLLTLKNLGSGMDIIMYYVTNISLAMSYVQEFSFAISDDLREKLYSQERPMDIGASVLATAAFIAPEKTGDYRQIMANMGYPEEQIDALFLSYYNTVKENELRVLFLKGNISIDHLYVRMRELGYTDTRTEEIVQTWQVTPPITDLTSFASRGLFNPETRHKWPWMFESPSGYLEWAKKQGLSEDWADMYWANHWVQPGLMETFSMLHRGLIPQNDVKFALEARGFSEYWQEKLLGISYNPYTRVDVRRMHNLGVLSDKELLYAYMDLGYDREKAYNMVKFTLKYNKETGRDLTRSQIIDAYQSHLIGSDEAIELLKSIDYSGAEADFLLTYYNYKYQKDIEDRKISVIGDKYKNNLLDSSEARDKLNRLALDGQRIEILMDEWQIDKFEDRKLPSKTDLDKFFKNNIIEEYSYRLEMRKLGYKEEYIDWYLELSKMKKPKG